MSSFSTARTLTRCTLTGNSADEGGGLYAHGTTITAEVIVEDTAVSFNAAVARTFRLKDRITLDWRIDAMNVLNRVTYSAVNTQINSLQFGLPTLTNDPRRLRSSIRVGF